MIWSLFRRPASFAETPRLKRYTVALSESVPDMTSHWRGEHLMTIAATSPEEARQQALDKARRVGIHLPETAVTGVRGGDRDA